MMNGGLPLGRVGGGSLYHCTQRLHTRLLV